MPVGLGIETELRAQASCLGLREDRVQKEGKVRTVRIVRTLFAGALLAVLAGCAGNVFPLGNTYITDQLDATESMSASGDAFTQGLHQEYMWVARTEYASGAPASMAGTLIFNKKSAAAAGGEAVAPMDPSAVAVDDPDVLDGYERLMAAADRGGADKAPAAMARAQAAFDCWVFAVCNGQTAVAEECMNRFLDAIAEVESALAPTMAPVARNYIIYFDWDSSAIRQDAAQVLNDVLAAVAGGAGSKVFAVGHADRSGSQAYNLGLSDRRAQSTRNYLTNGGLGAANILIDARGEDAGRNPEVRDGAGLSRRRFFFASCVKRDRSRPTARARLRPHVSGMRAAETLGGVRYRRAAATCG